MLRAMGETDNHETDGLEQPAQRLREDAKERLARSGMKIDDLSETDVRALAEELQIHQVELEMQNEQIREAEHDAAQARDRYRDLFENAPVGYLTLDADCGIIDSNAAAASLIGHPRTALAGQPLGRFIAHDSQDDWFRHRYAARREGTRQIHALHLSPGDGAERIVHIETIRAPGTGDGSQTERFLTALFDTTAQHTAERALAAERDQLEARVAARTKELEAASQAREQLVEGLGQGIFSLDSEGRFASLNPAALEMLGYECQSQLVGYKAHGLIHETDTKTSGTGCPICDPTGETVVARQCARLITAGGDSISVDLHARPVRQSGAQEAVIVALTRASEASQALSRLSRREHEVTTHLVQGKTNREVGETLGISRRTVEEYRASVMRKLEVSSFAELVRLAGELDDVC